MLSVERREKITNAIFDVLDSPVAYWLTLMLAGTVGIAAIGFAISLVLFIVVLLLTGPFGLFAIPVLASQATWFFVILVLAGWAVMAYSSITGLMGTKEKIIRAHGVEGVGQGDNLFEIVAEITKKAELPRVPMVGIYPSNQPNAFAAGSSESDAVVAFSSALVSAFSPDELAAIAAHEVAHIKNGDMVRMQLGRSLQNGILSVFLLAPVKAILRNTVFSLSQMLVMRLSRRREYVADAMAAEWVGAKKMESALAKLAGGRPSGRGGSDKFAMLKITAEADDLFSTHPAIANRIDALENQSPFIKRLTRKDLERDRMLLGHLTTFVFYAIPWLLTLLMMPVSSGLAALAGAYFLFSYFAMPLLAAIFTILFGRKQVVQTVIAYSVVGLVAEAISFAIFFNVARDAGPEDFLAVGVPLIILSIAIKAAFMYGAAPLIDKRMRGVD